MGGGFDIGLKVGILAEIGNMLHKCAVPVLIFVTQKPNDNFYFVFLLLTLMQKKFDSLSKIVSCRKSGAFNFI